jgi:hypothetical protein
MPKKKKTKKNMPTASTADIHDLYEEAVQNVDHEAKYIDRLFKRVAGRPAVSLKEDFSGTSSLCCEWVRRKPERTAVGVDFHRPTLDWGLDNRLAKLSDEQRARITLVHDDVLKYASKPKVDMITALNFSYFCFKTRDILCSYFKKARASLKPDGLYLLDAYGGSDAQLEMEDDPKECEGFDYVWEHALYNPITGETVCHIHFDMHDGTKLRKAFSYKWRLWSLPEIQELLGEAGFSSVEVHWEGTDSDGEGNGIFRKSRRGEACESWVSYVVARP